MQIEMLKDGAWMINGKAIVFKKSITHDVSEELAEKIVKSGYGQYIKKPEPVTDHPGHLSDLVTPENKAHLGLSIKSEESEEDEKSEKKEKKGKK